MALKTQKKSRRAIGSYDLVEKIGEGGMGTVYKARHQGTGDTVAVKVLSPARLGKPVLLKRFEQEFRAASSLDHPNIVRGLDFGFENGTTYLVMEFVDGESLGKRIDRDGRLPEAEAVRLISQVARGLHAAHRQGMIHRDLKPDNILLTADGQAKLIDLGLVKHLREDNLNLTRPNTGLGTPNFIAPEQFADAKNADVRSDIYSLAATLYMAVTGKLPFAARGLGSILKLKTSNELQPPRRLVPELSEHLDAAIRRAMSADPKDRPASCLEFVAELTKPSSGQRPAKTARSTRSGPLPTVAAKPSGAERRATVRYPSNQEGSCLPVSGAKDYSWSAKVQDVSTAGVSLLLSRRFEPDTVLLVHLHDPESSLPHGLLVRVVHVKSRARGKWLLGCTFARRLSDDEMQALR